MRFVTTFAAVLVAATAGGHHSDAGMEMDSVVTLEGIVTAFNWRNPHVYFTVETNDENGGRTEWAVQMGSTITVTRMGWTRESLSGGDRVAVQAHPARDGRPYGILQSIEKAGGVTLPTTYYAPEVTAAASSLAGIWMVDTSKVIRYPGGFDGFFSAQLTLTEQGKAAQAEYDALSDENPETTCIGRPTPSALVSNLYPLVIQINEEEQTIVLRTEFFDDERTLYMDGRGHPERGERFNAGHSIGWREGDVLVVDTTNFADHRSPYQIGVPSGAQKHVVERYRLIEDGTRIVASFLLEDPEYIAEPLTHTRELIYSPQMELSRFNCDPEVTRRFIPQ